MHNRLDYLAKYILQQLLDPRGPVSLQHETGVPDSQFIDALFTPDATLLVDDRPPSCALIDRMSPGLTAFEPYSAPISRAAFREAHRKQLTLHHRLVLEALRGASAQPSLPLTWALMPSVPRFLAREYGATPLVGWPRGFYALPSGFRFQFVALNEIPRRRDTLPLRLLGGASSRAEALKEITSIPLSDPDGRFLHDLGASLQPLLAHDNNICQEDRSTLMTWAWNELNRIKNEVRNEGRNEGAQVARQAIADLCELLNISWTPDRQQLVERLSLHDLNDLRLHLKQHRAWPAF